MCPRWDLNPRWAAERGTATTRMPGCVEVGERMDKYWECVSQGSETSDPPSVLLLLLRTILNSMGVSLWTVWVTTLVA